MYLGCRFYPFVYVEFSRIPLKKLAYIYSHVPSTVKLGLREHTKTSLDKYQAAKQKYMAPPYRVFIRYPTPDSPHQFPIS
jgi:hypothetical protein